jgi:type I restriction enzyme R subunit
MSEYTEDFLVQQTTANYLKNELGWDSIYAYNEEAFGLDGTLGRLSDREVVLTRYLRTKLVEFNPGLPDSAYHDAISQIVETSAAQTIMTTNREKYALLIGGVRVGFRNSKGELKKERLRVFDFEQPDNNHFLCVRELWIRGSPYRRRADIIGFVNGIPLLFMECKNIHKDLRTAYEKNLADYKDTIPHIFHHNAFVILANGDRAKIGTFSSKYEHFGEWKRLAEEEQGVVDMETLIKGVCDKRNFMDLFENFIVFDDSSAKTYKILARNHQFLGVNRAIKSVENRQSLQGKLGVFWHTQGAGKSYSMVFFARKIHRKIGGNFTFLICTDRDDLDTQIYKTFAGCGLADNDRDPCRARDGDHLKRLLGEHKGYVFSLIQKFNKEISPGEEYSLRDDVIVISDEAHRTQSGILALNMRNALPKSSRIGFTGTPLFRDDEITRRIFGDYVSTYDFDRAVEDKATVPLYYDARGEKLGVATTELNEQIASKLEELEIDDINVSQRLQRALKKEYHVITAHNRLKQIAEDMVQHYSTAWESGKAMLICIDKLTCVKMYNLIQNYWQRRITELERNLPKAEDEQEEIFRRRQIDWMKETQIAVVISEEQGEVDKFRKWNLDIVPHRTLLKEGFEIPENLRKRSEYASMQRLDPDSAFKEQDHPFRLAIVCAMWLTGFDVPSLSTLYLDKPLKAHTLMQAIARANRVNEGKENGLIIDYCGILKNLRKALATYVGQADRGRSAPTGREADPTKPEEELLTRLAEAISMVRAFLSDSKASLDNIISKTGFHKNAAIIKAKEAANQNDETRQRFEVMCREVFNRFKASLNCEGINKFRKDYDAINVVYRSLQVDREQADISDVMRQLHEVIDKVIELSVERTGDKAPYDISKIDFTRLKKEFEHSPIKRTTVQNLKQVVEKRLRKMMLRNPLRADLQKHYEQIVDEYNREKDRVTIEQTFEALLKFVRGLDAEETRAMREGLDEESLAIFDILRKPELAAAEIKRVKEVAVELLKKLKRGKLRIDHWREKESSRDAVKVTIRDFLWSDVTGLPLGIYSEGDIENKTEDIFQHVHHVYPTLPSPFFARSNN